MRERCLVYMTDSPQQAFVDGLADFFAAGARTPILRRPDELGLDYEDVFFRLWTE